MIIAIEGITNSGKSTIAELLQNRILVDYRVKLINDYTLDDSVYNGIARITNPSETLIDPISEMFLYASSLSRKSFFVENFLSNFDVVIIDRQIISFITFFHYVRNLPYKIVRPVGLSAVRNRLPDLTILAEASLQTVLARSVVSPLSRKDRGIEEFIETYKLGQIKESNNFSIDTLRISIDTDSIDDLIIKLNKVNNYMDF